MRLVRFIGWGGGGGGGGEGVEDCLYPKQDLTLQYLDCETGVFTTSVLGHTSCSVCVENMYTYMCVPAEICECVGGCVGVCMCVCVCVCVCVCMHECLHFCLFCEIISVLLLKEINLNVFAFKMFCQYFCFCASSPFQPCLQRGRLEICWKMEPVRLSHLHDHHSRFNRHLHRHRFFPQYHRLARWTQLLIRKWQSVVSDCVYC